MKNKITYPLFGKLLLIGLLFWTTLAVAQTEATIKMPIKFKVDASTEVLGQLDSKIRMNKGVIKQKVTNQFNIKFDFSNQNSSEPRIDFMLKKISGDVVSNKVKLIIAHAWSKPFEHGKLIISDNCYSGKRGRYLYLTDLKNGKGNLSIPFAIASSDTKCGEGGPSSEIIIRYEILGISEKAPEPVVETLPDPIPTPGSSEQGDIGDSGDQPNPSERNPGRNKPDLKPDPIKDTWLLLADSGDVEAYKAFLEKYPNSDFAPSAEKEITRWSEMILSYDTLAKNEYRFTLQNVLRPRIDSIVPAEGVEITSKLSRNGKTFEIRLLDSRKHTLYLSDSGKPSEVRFIQSPLSNLMIAAMEESETGNLMFTFKGGIPPYTVYFKQGKRYVHISPAIYKNNWSLEKAVFSPKAIAGTSPEPVYAEVWDSLKVTYFAIKTPIVVEQPQALWPFLLGGLGLLGLGFLVFRYSQNAKRKKMQDLVEKRKKELNLGQTTPRKTSPRKESTRKVDAAPPKAESKAEIKVNAEEIIDAALPGEHTETQEVEENLMPQEDKKQGFVIKKIRKAHKEGGSDVTKLGSSEAGAEEYYLAPLNQHWTDSKIEKIGLSKKAILGLNKFLHAQNVSVMEETEGSVPEIGGFLMGSFFQEPDKEIYQVTIEEFVPVSPSFNNVYQLEFSTQSIVQELGDAQDHFPDLSLIGWFHTHPGHGLFLSKPDLTIHEGFFREPYQFAMEIDSMTEDLDCAFFSRKSDGQMNNKDSRIPGSTWFPWVEIEKFTRRKV